MSVLEKTVDQLSVNQSDAHNVEAKLVAYLPLQMKNLELFEEKLKKEKNAITLVNIYVFSFHSILTDVWIFIHIVIQT